MGEYVLTCCSTSDLPESFYREHNIPYACFHFIMDGVEYEDNFGKSMSFEEFYKRIEKGAEPTTSQVNVEQFEALFEPFLQAGKDLLHISLSSGLSGAYNSARIACEDLQARYPERKIYVVDSLGGCGGYGLLVTMATEKREAGMSIEELHNWLEENKLTIHHWFFSTDLTSFYRGGRITKTSHLIGTVLNICPLMNVNFEGKLIPREKYRGKKKVIAEMVKHMETFAQDGKDYSGLCYINHSACEADALAVATLIEERFPKLNGNVRINSIGTTIGSHTGPGTVALFFVGTQRID